MESYTRRKFSTTRSFSLIRSFGSIDLRGRQHWNDHTKESSIRLGLSVMICFHRHGVLLEAMCEENSTGINESWIRLVLSTIFLFGSDILLVSTGTINSAGNKES